jgi:hypothetical protein
LKSILKSINFFNYPQQLRTTCIAQCALLFVCLLYLHVACPAKAFAVVTDKQWQELLTAVGSEDWNAAVDRSLKCLMELKEDDDRLPRLRYMVLYSAAGKVSKQEMSFDELDKLSQQFVGKKVVLPYREILPAGTNGFNLIIPPANSKGRVYVAASDKTGATIFLPSNTRL